MDLPIESQDRKDDDGDDESLRRRCCRRCMFILSIVFIFVFTVVSARVQEGARVFFGCIERELLPLSTRGTHNHSELLGISFSNLALVVDLFMTWVKSSRREGKRGARYVLACQRRAFETKIC